MWRDYKWMLCQTKRRDGVRQNFDYGLSLHTSEAQAENAKQVHLRWHKVNPATLYVQELPDCDSGIEQVIGNV